MPTGPPATADEAGLAAPPRWFDNLLVVILAAVVGFGGVGLVLALAGRCTPAAAAIGGSVALAVLVRLGWTAGPPGQRTGGTGWTAAAVVVALGSVFVNAPNAAEHVIVNRDPGVYLVTGRWIADHGTVRVPAETGPFADADEIVSESAGTYEVAGGGLDFQFTHLLAVLLAEAYWLGGDRLLVIVPVLIGAAALLTTYALAVRLTGRPWAGFIVVCALATCLPVLAAVRDTYSEGVTWLLLTGGLWVWSRANDESRPGMAMLGGLVLGTIATARIDALVYLVPVPLLIGLAATARSSQPTRVQQRTAVALAVGLLFGVALGSLDLLTRSNQYYRDLHGEVIALWAAFALAAGLGLAMQVPSVRRLEDRRLSPWIERHRRVLAYSAAAVIVVVAGLAWFVRPHLQEARTAGTFEYIGAIQADEGQPVEPDRRYDERSVEWLSWYIGLPAVALGIVGGAIVVHESARKERGERTGMPWLVLAAGTTVYLWQPSITPDQIWASRRFVPAVLPLVATLAAVAVVAAVDGVRRHRPDRPLLASAVGMTLALAVVVPPATRSVPVAALSDQHSYLELVDDLCGEVSGGAVVAVEDERAGITLPQTMRSFCDVPVGVLTADEPTPASLAGLAREWAVEHRVLRVIAASEDVVTTLVPGAAVTVLGPYRSDQALEVTVTRLPSRLVEVGDTFFMAVVPPAD